MKVELNQDAVDAIFQSMLLQDYVNLKSDTKRLKESKNLAEYQMQDLEDNKMYLKAMKTLLPYYVGFDWKEKLPKE